MLEKKIIYFLVALSKLSSNNLKKYFIKKKFEFFFLVGSGQWVSQCPGTTLQKKINLFIFSGSPEQAESNSGFSEKIC